MMSTTVLPQAAASEPATDGVRYPTVFANLLPEEVIAGRRLGKLKRRIGFGLIALVVILAASYGWSVWSTINARSDLAAAQHESVTLQNRQRAYAPLVAAQSQSAAIKAGLSRLMAGDLAWTSLLTTLRANAGDGITISNLAATMTPGAASPAAGSGGLGVLNQTGKLPVGTLNITGLAPDKNAVAAFIDRLSKVPGLAAPFPANVTGQSGKVNFSANVLITSDALGGRYAASTATQGGH